MAVILIVEDNGIVARDLQRAVRRLGHSAPSLAASGREAVDEAIELRPDLILMDINLRGEMDGIAAATALRERMNVPVVYLTSYADDATLERAFATDPFGYILKPFDVQQVRVAIDVALFKHRVESVQRDRERWYTSALGAVTEAVITSGLDGRITYINAAGEALLGRARATVSGTPVATALGLRVDGSDALVHVPGANAVNDGARVDLPAGTRVRRSDGTDVQVSGHATPITRGGEEPIGTVLVLRPRDPS